MLAAAGAAVVFVCCRSAGRAAAAGDGWSPASAVSESPTREGSPQLAELKSASGEPGGRTLLTCFQFGPDGVAHLAQRTSDDGVNWSDQRLIPGTENGVDPAAAQLADGEIIVVYTRMLPSSGKNEVDMVRSRDLNNWSAPQTLVPAAGDNSAFVPDIVALSSGRIVVAYSSGVEQLRSDIYMITSDDAGASWSRPQLIYGGPQYDSRAQLIELADGELLAAFYTSPAFPAGSGIPRRGDILVTRSADGGATWQAPAAIAADAGRDECWVSLLDRGGGEIWAAFTIDEGDHDPARPPAIQLTKSFDGGHTWGSPATLDNGGRRMTWPALAGRPDGSVILVTDDDAWYDGSSRDYWSLWQRNTAGLTTHPSQQLWCWYDARNGRDWLLSANLGNEPLYQQAGIAGAPIDAVWVDPGKLAIRAYPGMIGGPLTSSSLTGKAVVASQRVLWDRDSFEELPALDATRLASAYYWPWYDQSTRGYTDWIVLDNPNSTPAYYEISIGGLSPDTSASGNIDPGGNVTKTFAGKSGGPVMVRAWTDAGRTAPADIAASQRVLTAFGAAFNEVAGIPAGSLSAGYIWPWYDDIGGSDWIIIANPNSQPVDYRIDLNSGCTATGSLSGDQACQTGAIDPGAEITPRLGGKIGGPLKLTTWFATGEPASCIASQRTLWGPSFEELPGQPAAGIASRYDWTWYDMKSPGATNWVLIVNPNETQISYEIKIGGSVMPAGPGNPGIIPAHGKATPVFPGVMAGPVELTASGNVVASQRVIWNGHFNEILGAPR